MPRIAPQKTDNKPPHATQMDSRLDTGFDRWRAWDQSFAEKYLHSGHSIIAGSPHGRIPPESTAPDPSHVSQGSAPAGSCVEVFALAHGLHCRHGVFITSSSGWVPGSIPHSPQAEQWHCTTTPMALLSCVFSMSVFAIVVCEFIRWSIRRCGRVVLSWFGWLF